MKKLSFHSSTFLLFSALIVLFCFAGRPMDTAAGRPAGPTETAVDTVGDDIAKIQELFRKAFITGDSTLFLKGYTQDACVLAPNAPALCGQRGVARFFANTRAAGIRGAMFTDLGLYGQTEEYVTQQGAFEVFDADQHSLAKGKVLILFKKTDEGWRIFRHSLNFDAPPPAPATK